ncbi:acyltransferase family protein [Dysgonomonas sp. 25]|uniref:acyltransferase family protein n=1 Tax=Dysgonomonas sp. 25 TaxID=2302933 RepID=UPI0013D3671E|nr:acyltransferase family protein [Dysgonomonas sp. 25]NDV69020.1 acyltransferase [Dysgonomonas sp. 25]
MEYRKDIQGLRAIAVLSVWIFHLNENILPGGFIGVDIFFVISGFLISSIILHQKENNKFTFQNFYISRIKRIIPAYYVFLIVITVATILVYLPADLLFNYRLKFLHSFIFNSNNYFATLDNYFGAASTENPLLHTWTLAIEMQFYLFLPLLVFLLNRKRCLYIAIIICVLLYSYAQYQILSGYQNLMYFSLPARIPEFLLGVILSLIKWENKLSDLFQSILGGIGFLLIVLSTIFFNSDTLFPGLTTLIPCFGAILILANKKGGVNKILSNKVMVYIGELSYSIYLWHWGILALMRYYYVEYELTFAQYLFAILLTFFLSYISYQYIENKFRKLNLKQFLIYFSVVPVTIIILGLSMKAINLFIHNNNYPAHLVSSEPMGLNNHAQFIKDDILGDTSSKDTLLLLGHSHALVMKPFLDSIGKLNHFCFRSITNNRYADIPGYQLSYFSNKTDYDKYIGLTDIVRDKIKNTPLVIVCTTFEMGELSDHLTAFETLHSMINNNQHIILLADFPTLDRNPIRVNRGVLRNSEKNAKFEIKYDKPPKELLDYMNKYPNFHFLDISDSPAFKDSPYYQDTIMYYDAGHLNIYGSLTYAKYSGHQLSELIDSILHR